MSDQTSLALNRVNRVQRRLTSLRNTFTDEVYKTDDNLIPDTDAEYDLGSDDNQFANLYLSDNATVGGRLTVTGAAKFALVKTSETAQSYSNGDTVVATDLLDGIIVVDTSSVAVGVTTATAADIVGEISNASEGDVVKFLVVANGNNAVTVSGGEGVTVTNGKIHHNSSRVFYARLDVVLESDETITIY